MSSRRSKDSSSLCTFTFSDGRQCRLPHSPAHPTLCTTHARKQAISLASEQTGEDIARLLSRHYVSACDLTVALARLLSGVAQGHVKPKTAATMAFLGQTLAHTLPLAEHEFINAFGTEAWRKTIRSSFAASQPSPLPEKPAELLESRPAQLTHKSL